MKQSKIAVIIVNWNGKHLLEECLSSVESQDYDNFKIIFVDNGSEDKSVEFVKEKFSKVEVISLDKNTGFAKGNNIGINKAFEDLKVEYIALLNNDAIVEKNWLSEMVKVIEQDNKIGSVAPRILKYYKRDEFDSLGMKIRMIGSGMNNLVNEKNDDRYDMIVEVFGPSGCSCLYKRDALEDICIFNEYFDNDFFAFCEDVDLNWRMRLRRWKSFVAPKSIVYHKGSESFQVYSFSKAFYSHRNRLFVILKNYPLKYFIKGMLIFIFSYVYYFISILNNKGYSARTKEKIGYLNTAKFIFKGWISFFMFLPKMIKKRHTIQKKKQIINKDFKECFSYFGENKNVTQVEYINKKIHWHNN